MCVYRLTQAIHDLEVLRSCKLLRACRSEFKDEVHGLLQMVVGLSEGCGPKPDGLGFASQFYQQATNLMQNFHVYDCGCPGQPKLQYGRRALGFQYEGCKALVEQGKSLDFDMVKPFRIFSWVLTRPERIQANVWINKHCVSKVFSGAKQITDAVDDSLKQIVAVSDGCDADKTVGLSSGAAASPSSVSALVLKSLPACVHYIEDSAVTKKIKLVGKQSTADKYAQQSPTTTSGGDKYLKLAKFMVPKRLV
jgi:hypothetical protein